MGVKIKLIPKKQLDNEIIIHSLNSASSLQLPEEEDSKNTFIRSFIISASSCFPLIIIPLCYYKTITYFLVGKHGVGGGENVGFSTDELSFTCLSLDLLNDWISVRRFLYILYVI